jgi:hypothetical protein
MFHKQLTLLINSLQHLQNQMLVDGLNDGSATITSSGGTAPYTYSWNTSVKT